MRVLWLLVSTVCISLTGCGGEPSFEMVPVSGIVTMDGEPLAGATVTFLPKSSGDMNAGPASLGETDAAGQFTLKTGEGEPGAVVASHQVMITTVKDSGTSTADDNVYAEAEPEKVPPRYNSETGLNFVVPTSGSTDANFELTSDREQ